MWRLLYPESRLIHATQVANRVICVQKGIKKSITHVVSCTSCTSAYTPVLDDCMDAWLSDDHDRLTYKRYILPTCCEFNKVRQRVDEIKYEDDFGELSSKPSKNLDVQRRALCSSSL
ncbi:RNA polymerase II C-terminal domain phosphatase-like 1 [Striga asiatica]|uniref:RNA polymerase II C-terminal domain phosphatase-like 1 n=1 Tax=Striga asiatica TaxID=4170 RepID=A0A5A7QYY6_STRAF|nr:RNA polymerase II C-terminal domain phosphatase-like 1 [Striga asiatica]